MEPDNVKRKISEEIDSSAEHEFSENVKSEIESNEELKKFADDIVKIEALLEDLNEQTGRDFDPSSLKEKISRAVREAPKGENGEAGEYLSEPMPESNEERESQQPREPAFTFPAVSAVEAEAAKEEQDPMRLTARRLKAGAAGDDSSGLINLGALVQEHRESQAPPVDEKAAAMPGLPPPAAQKGKRAGLYIMIALFAIVGIAAIIQIGRMSRSKISKEEPGAAMSTLDKQALEAELKAELMASMEEKKASQVGKTDSPEPGLTVSEDEAGEAEGQEEAGITLAKKAKKKSGAGHGTAAEMESAPDEKAAGGAKDEGEKAVDPKDKSQKDLMSLLDSATSKKQPSEGSEKPSKKGGGPSVEELMGEGKKDAPKESEQDASLPATLSKNQIRAVMQKLNSKIMKCGEGKVGNLILNLVVSNDGSVKSAKASGEFANDPTGKCAENVAKGAKFPPFKNPTMNVTYPYRFTPPVGI